MFSLGKDQPTVTVSLACKDFCCGVTDSGEVGVHRESAKFLDYNIQPCVTMVDQLRDRVKASFQAIRCRRYCAIIEERSEGEV